MPALYAHDRFGSKVLERLPKEQQDILLKYHDAFSIGLQGPDIFFFYRPYSSSWPAEYGSRIHATPALGFFGHALIIVRQYSCDSPQYAYLMGFICHFTLDSECHPYVSERIHATGVPHMEIEEEFEKLLLRLDGRDPFGYPLSRLIPTDLATARAIAPFYSKVNVRLVQESLRWTRFVKALFHAPCPIKQGLLNTAIDLLGKSDMKGLVHQRWDNYRCVESNAGLLSRFNKAVPLAASLIMDFDEAIHHNQKLNKRFNRTFE